MEVQGSVNLMLVLYGIILLLLGLNLIVKLFLCRQLCLCLVSFLVLSWRE